MARVGQMDQTDATHLLNQVHIPNPCPVPWSDMTGDDRVRFCRQCRRHVYQLAQFTAEDGARLVTTSGDELCVRIARRQDGSVATAGGSVLPTGRRRRPLVAGLRLLASIWAGILFLTGCQGSS